MVFGVLRALLPNPEAAEEVIQDAFHAIRRAARDREKPRAPRDEPAAPNARRGGAVTQHPTDDLGLYALGLLDRGERDAIDRHLAECAVCQTELETHRSTLAALAPEPAMPAAADLRRRIVARHERTWWRGFPALGYAAAAVLAVALVVSFNAFLHERALRDDYARALSAVATGARVVPLQPQADAPLRGALVLPRDGVAYLVLALPPPPAGKAYEAWVIRGGVATAVGM